MRALAIQLDIIAVMQNLSPYLTANRDRAMQELRKVVAENPVDRDALIRLGNLCMACGQFF